MGELTVVCKPDISCRWVNGHIVATIEVVTEVVVQEDLGFTSSGVEGVDARIICLISDDTITDGGVVDQTIVEGTSSGKIKWRVRYDGH